MNNQGIRILAFIKQVIYSLMIIAFVFLTSCIVKNSLWTALFASSSIGHTVTNYAYISLSSLGECAISETAKDTNENDGLKKKIFPAIIRFTSDFFTKSADLYSTRRHNYSLIKLFDRQEIWLLICIFRL